jgi:DNA-binding transcriptional MerR regulator
MAERIRIGDLAKQAQVTTRTIRYYDELGLLPHDDEREGGDFRYYSEVDLQRLHKIDALKKLGLTLDEIKSVLDFYFSDPTGIEGKQKVLGILQSHLRETEEKITTLQAFRLELQSNIARMYMLIEEAKRQ